ncbi:MAG: carbon-nitrogen hydrolase family protein [Gemmatimonadaceae bacterium]
MRVTVCELPHEPSALALAWVALCEHAFLNASELVLLPEFAMVEPVWYAEHFDHATWEAVEALSNVQLARLSELGAEYVVGTRPVTIGGRRFNQGYIWSAAMGLVPLRSKFFLPAEEGSWETRWFDRGDAAFPAFRAGKLSFGLNICTELWALETYGAYAALGVQIIMSPRATAAATTSKWLSVGVVAAVRSGAYSVSSNRLDASGACGGVGWIISPDGKVLARTTPEVPFATMNIDLTASMAARAAYPRYVFSETND